MIYIETDNNNKVTFIHYMPFDETHGMHTTLEQLEQTGYLVESLPEVTQKEGFNAILHYNPSTKEFYIEYEEISLSETEQLQKQVGMQEQAIAELSMYIATLGV